MKKISYFYHYPISSKLNYIEKIQFYNQNLLLKMCECKDPPRTNAEVWIFQ